MALHIDDGSTSLELDGAEARVEVRIGAVWRVIGLPMLLNHNEAIAALTLAEWLLSGRDADAVVRTVASAQPSGTRRIRS
jgi:hypothetical protein